MDASFDYIYPRIHQSHLPIKQLLLDQSIFTGIGNIYANEICFRMGMDPRTRGDRLSKKRIEELIQVSSTILKEAIAQGGTTIHSFDANGIHGLFQVTLSVHAQTTCSKCKGPIKKSQLQEEEHITVLIVRKGDIKYVELGCNRIRKNCPEIL